MKWTYYVKQKTKVAVLLFCIMVCILLVRLLVDQSVRYINNSLISLYKDRLIPSSDLFYVADYLHKKKYALLDFVYGDNPSVAEVRELQSKMDRYNRHIDSLVHKYGKTYLVVNEKDHLGNFKKLLATGLQLEKQYMGQLGLLELLEKKDKLMHADIIVAYDQAINKLADIEKIQTQVGKEITNEAQSLVKGIRAFSLFQVVLSIIIGTMIVALVLASKSVIQRKEEPYHLN